jgi:crotonobetainyl-CoA:carnitine CoA-transferase CaiB-like acyl-CoA transferase
VRYPAPELGQHNEEIRRELAALAAKRVREA